MWSTELVLCCACRYLINIYCLQNSGPRTACNPYPLIELPGSLRVWPVTCPLLCWTCITGTCVWGRVSILTCTSLKYMFINIVFSYLLLLILIILNYYCTWITYALLQNLNYYIVTVIICDFNKQVKYKYVDIGLKSPKLINTKRPLNRVTSKPESL